MSKSADKVAPPIRLAAAWRIREIRVVDRRLALTFGDGLSGEADLGEFLASRRVEGTIFEALRDPAFFAAFTIALGAPQWPNGADFAPDAVYDVIRATGQWRPE